jgi:DNA-directed RNA polymerase subunit RPC12/RpoP
MATLCPKCDKDIFQQVYEDHWEDEDFRPRKFECPYCEAKLITTAEIEYYVEEE